MTHTHTHDNNITRLDDTKLAARPEPLNDDWLILIALYKVCRAVSDRLSWLLLWRAARAIHSLPLPWDDPLGENR